MNILLSIYNLHLTHISHETEHSVHGHNALSIYNFMKVATTKVVWLNSYLIHKKINNFEFVSPSQTSAKDDRDYRGTSAAT